MIQTKQILQDIAQAFAQTSNKSMIDLVKLRDFVNKDKNVSQNHIFMKKLKDLEDLDSISKFDFQDHFTPNVKDKKHFDYVFDSVDIDKSKQISKNQLQRINEDYKLNLTAQDIDIMISSVSKDKQKVKKQDLYAFLLNQ